MTFFLPNYKQKVKIIIIWSYIVKLVWFNMTSDLSSTHPQRKRKIVITLKKNDWAERDMRESYINMMLWVLSQSNYSKQFGKRLLTNKKAIKNPEMREKKNQQI